MANKKKNRQSNDLDPEISVAENGQFEVNEMNCSAGSLGQDDRGIYDNVP